MTSAEKKKEADIEPESTDIEKKKKKLSQKECTEMYNRLLLYETRK